MIRRLGAAAAALLALGVCCIPLSDPDRPWHLAAGRWIVENGRVPRVDFLTWTKAGVPWVDFEWAGQVLFYAAQRLGGAGALLLLKAAGLALVLFLVLRLLELWRVPGAWKPWAAAFLSLSLIPVSDLRPELFSYILLLVQLHHLEELRLGRRRHGGRSLVFQALQYAAWANLHAAFALGLAVCGLYALAHVRRRPRPWVLLTLAAAAATLLNPYGPRLYSVHLAHLRELAAWRGHIQEWAAPRLADRFAWSYWAAVAFSLGGLAWASLRGVRRCLPHLLVAAALAGLSAVSYRFTTYVPLICFPLALYALRRAPRPALPARVPPLLLALLAAAAIGGQSLRLLRQERVFTAVDTAARYEPARAVDFMLANAEALAGLRMFNPYNWGGYFAWRLFPRYRHFIDGRYIFADYLRPLAEAERDLGGWQLYLEERGIELAVLESAQPLVRKPAPMFALWRPFDSYSMPRRDWAVVYWDSQAMILVKRTRADAAWLAKAEYRYLRPNDLSSLSAAVITKTIAQGAVEAEVWRYLREIADPDESRKLLAWVKEIRRESPVSVARR